MPSRDDVWEEKDWNHMQNRLRNRSELQDSGCVLWNGAKDDKGYGILQGSRAHIWSYMCHHQVGPRLPKGTIVRHSCHTPACINIEHLSLGSSLDNAQDRVRSGRSALGEMCTTNKILKEIARTVKYDTNGTRSEIANRYDVSKTTVDAIKRGMTWNWLGETPEQDDRTIMSNQKKPPAMMLQPYSEELYRDGRYMVRNHVQKKLDEEGEHWLYNHANQSDPYARIRFNGVEIFAHRLSYKCYTEKDLPQEIAVRHKCHIPKCVNPEHLVASPLVSDGKADVEEKSIIEDVVMRAKIVNLEAEDDTWKALQTDQKKASELLSKNAQIIHDGNEVHHILEKQAKGKIGFKGTEWCVSRLSWFAHHGVEAPPKKFVLRNCSQALCFNPDHLFLADQATANHCTQAEKNGMAKITSEIALAIFNDSKLNQKDRASKYKVSVSTVKAIDQGRQWSSVTGCYHKDIANKPKRKRVRTQ